VKFLNPFIGRSKSTKPSLFSNLNKLSLMPRFSKVASSGYLQAVISLEIRALYLFLCSACLKSMSWYQMDALFGGGPEELLAAFPILFEAIGPNLTWVGVWVRLGFGKILGWKGWFCCGVEV